MFFSSARRLGTFLLNRELVVDWEQYHAREDRHALATDRLEKLSACTDVVKEISELLPVFVAHHDVDTVHQLVKTISEQHEADLRPCHYNSLLRVLTFYRKKESLENVWKAMTERGCVDEESCACVITALYALGVDEWLSAGLNVVALLEKSGQKLAIDSPHGMGNQSLVLSALLHAVSKSKYGPLATLCVAFWMKALGVRLSAWDYSNLLECLIREADTFPTIVETLMCVEANEYGELSFEDLAKCLCPDDARPASRVRQELLTAMRQSLAAHNVPLTKPISVGFLNCGIASLPTYLETIYDDMHVHKGLGPSGNNPLPVYHHTMLVHAALRNCTSALQMLPCTLERLHDWKHKYLSEAGKKGPHDDEEAAEPCEVGIYMLWDAAKLFGEVSQLTRHEIGPSFSQLTEEVAPKSSLIQMAYCGAYSLPLLCKEEEAKDALQKIIESAQSVVLLPRSVKEMFRQYMVLCTLHPPRNCKLTPRGLQMRQQWFGYYEARDIALTLYGNSLAGRNAMKTLYEAGNVLPPLRSPDVIRRDRSEFMKLFGLAEAPNLPPPQQVPQSASKNIYTVPRHMWDPAVPNPYPHVQMRMGVHNHILETDPFTGLWAYLRSCQDKWYAKEAEAYLLLLRCLLQRLDWEGAVGLTTSALESLSFNAEMDNKLCGLFEEIGDPFGAICFKMQTRIFDGRIQHNSPPHGPAATEEKTVPASEEGAT